MTRIKSDQNVKRKIDIVFYGWVSFFGTYTALYRSGQASLGQSWIWLLSFGLESNFSTSKATSIKLATKVVKNDSKIIIFICLV